MLESGTTATSQQLFDIAKPSEEKVLNPKTLEFYGGIRPDAPVLLVLAAGKGTRFGQEPKCIQMVHGTPLARHSIDAFRHVSASPVICIVGYRHVEVSAALGADNIYIRTDNPAGGTAFATAEAFSVADLIEKDPLVIITMGDRIVPSVVFRRLLDSHRGGQCEAGLTFVTAQYDPPKNRGKGRVVRGGDGRVVRIVEEKDITAECDPFTRQALINEAEGNCPLYVIRARMLAHYLQKLSNDNAQGQYYLTDIVEFIGAAGGEIRTFMTTPADPEYDLLCSDVTQPMDLALLEGILASGRGLLFPEELEVERLAGAIREGRPAGQVASIAGQLRQLMLAAAKEELAFRPARPVGVGISGGRLRIAFMHPDMMRFFGPAWQMPIGAGHAAGEEQIVVLAQDAEDGRIRLYPLEPQYRENTNFVAADDQLMYPDENVCDLHSYETFGTHMSEMLLLSLGYFSEEELKQRRNKAEPLPPRSLWVANNMRRPFALVGNAIASLRTLRSGNLGARVQEHLGRGQFRGLRLISTGNIPQGGFSSSSAMTVATKNAINALFELGIPPDLLVHLACQAEYGTGVRAGSLDQATEQKGQAGQGTLISSNPRDNYRIIGKYPVPTARFQIIFPYTVERDRAAWRWSYGFFAELSAPGGPLTTSEMRKMTGKAAEIAAILTRLPLEVDFFKVIEEDLVADGLLTAENRKWVGAILRQIPLRATQEELRQLVYRNRSWYIAQIRAVEGVDESSAEQKADVAFASLFAGWRDPILKRMTGPGELVVELGVPLRAMLAYLFGEVAKNFYLLHHPEQWIDCITRSQRGDRCVEIDPDRLPTRAAMEHALDWERGTTGPALLDHWLERHGATPFDYNQGLDDPSLDAAPPEFHLLRGSSFFRGLPLIDLAEAMLKRAFGSDTVAVRVNAAGQGDYFQVHVDSCKADLVEVKRFLRTAFYPRFGLCPRPEFVELHPGGGASGVQLKRFDMLPQLIRALEVATSNDVKRTLFTASGR